MLENTKTALAAIVAADPTVSKADRARLLAALVEPKTEAKRTHDRILRRDEVAAMARRSKRTIDHWHRKGILQAVKLPGHTRGIGFRESAVHTLLGI